MDLVFRNMYLYKHTYVQVIIIDVKRSHELERKDRWEILNEKEEILSVSYHVNKFWDMKNLWLSKIHHLTLAHNGCLILDFQHSEFFGNQSMIIVTPKENQFIYELYNYIYIHTHAFPKSL